MPSQDTHYRLPDDSDSSIQRMLVGLGLFFATLLVIVALVLYYAQHIVQYVPFSAEQRFVRPYETLISRFFAHPAADPEIAGYLQQLSTSLEDSMGISSAIDITVHYIPLPEVNAFATLGGHILVFKGLIQMLPDENSLAMVLAHEIAHVSHRDPIASVGRGMALQMLFGFVFGHGSTAEDVLDAAGGSGLAMFSREQERQADLVALQTLNTRYGHVGGYRTFFELLRVIEDGDHAPVAEKTDALNEDHYPEWLSSHPATDERLEYLDTEVGRLGASVGVNVPLPTPVRELSASTAQALDQPAVH